MQTLKFKKAQQDRNRLNVDYSKDIACQDKDDMVNRDQINIEQSLVISNNKSSYQNLQRSVQHSIETKQEHSKNMTGRNCEKNHWPNQMQLKSNSFHSNIRSKRSLNLYNTDNFEDCPKQNLHCALFISTILVFLVANYANLYYIFGPMSQTQIKGIVASCSLASVLLFSGLAFYKMVTFKELIRLTFIVDNIFLATIASSLAFTSMIMLFDVSNDQWQYDVLEAGLPTLVFLYGALTKVFLVHLKWSKWRLIFFKISILVNNVMFYSMVVHFIVINFSYTNYLLPQFDSKVKDFMLLYIFAMFSYTYELYSKVTDFDHTCDLKYHYQVANMDKNLSKKRQSIKNQKRQSRVSLNRLGGQALLGLANLTPNCKSSKANRDNTAKSRFAQIQVVNNQKNLY